MTGSIKPGDWVECVDATGDQAEILVAGALYEVIAVGPYLGPAGHLPCVFVYPAWTEVRGGVYGGSAPERFRSVYSPKQKFIEALKATPQRVCEKAEAAQSRRAR